jgi:hypothetical protein
VAIITLPADLDRGERADWFDATEIIIYAGICAVAVHVFVVSNIMADKPFLNRLWRMRRDRFDQLGQGTARP